MRLARLGRSLVRLGDFRPGPAWASSAHLLFPPAQQALPATNLPLPRLWVGAAAHIHSSRVDRSTGDVATTSTKDEELEVEVITGDVRGGGTRTTSSVVFFGEYGVTEALPLTPDEQRGFKPGEHTVHKFRVESVGALRSARVHLHTTPDNEKDGWFLHEIRVRRAAANEWTSFPFGRWFGNGDHGGQLFPLEHEVGAADVRASDGPADWLRERPRVPLAAALAYRFGGATVPHPEKLKAGKRGVARADFGFGGEDAYFMAKGAAGQFVVGVADGVYMWREQGIDAGEFSRTLMQSASATVAAGCISPLSVLRKAYKAVSAQGVKGSTTVCIVHVDCRYGEVLSANIGDSGYLLMAPGRFGSCPDHGVKYRSPHQEHEFGRPFQLGHHDASDKPDDAMLSVQPIEPGDALVMGSDGLWDNLHDAEIAEGIVAGLAVGEGASALARRVAGLAYQSSMQKSADTPYARAATEEFDMVYSGGKRDDITVLVGLIDAAAP